METIRFGSRDSKLAVIQARLVLDTIEEPCELMTMKTTGDLILDRTLEQIGGKGLFVKELDRALAAKEVDFTVHSLKDMPMEQPKGLPIVAYSKREDPRDALVLAEGLQALDLTRPIGCASARRKIQLEKQFPDAVIKPIRGNIQTRLRKLDEGQYGALVLASAGLVRLGLTHRIARYFSIDEMLPAAGQGIVAVQGRADADVHCLERFADADARDCALAERSFVRTLDGGCTSPVAAYAEVTGSMLKLRGMYVNPEQTIVRFGDCTGARTQAEQLGQDLAERLRRGE
ncbi:MAG: hydroxymethylbilane synthase [Butyricicoccus pullicaecorum]|nr:hydroxymethylbilane synthase [Butyricicoccus pullicaecorum]